MKFTDICAVAVCGMKLDEKSIKKFGIVIFLLYLCNRNKNKNKNKKQQKYETQSLHRKRNHLPFR